jgi:hypothetical protein
MKRLSNLLLILFTVCCIGCAALNPAANEPATRPDDFRIEYEWRAGSLPPPWHYEYTIIIDSTRSEIVLIPDYPSAAAPKWAEYFKVEKQGLDDLHRVMAENGLFTQKWRRLDPAPVGGSNQKLVVTARGKRFKVEDYLISEQQDSAQAMYAAVRSLVPKEIWERLQAKRRQYMQEHPRR